LELFVYHFYRTASKELRHTLDTTYYTKSYNGHPLKWAYWDRFTWNKKYKRDRLDMLKERINRDKKALEYEKHLKEKEEAEKKMKKV